MSWDTLYTVGQTAGVILVMLTFGAGALTVYWGWRANKEQKEENRLKEEQRERERQVSDENIANANAEAAKANKGLAEANVRIAQANEQAQNAIAAAAEARAKQEELALESRAKQKELAEAQTQLVQEQRMLADAQRKQADAELALQQTLEAVQRRQGPRVLTEHQRTELIRALKQIDVDRNESLRRLPPGFPVPPFFDQGYSKRVSIVTLEVPEADNYASQITEAFRDAGWDPIVISGKTPIPPVIGIECQNCNASIQSALRSAGIPFRNRETREPVARLVIGLKEP